MDKLPNWRSKLDQCINEYENVIFKYGSHDCSTFVSDCILAQTGYDFAADFRGKYKSLNGGYKLCRKAGYADNVGVFEKQLTIITTSFASTGDVGVVQADDENQALCIIAGRFGIGLTEHGGLIRFDIARLVKVFKV